MTDLRAWAKRWNDASMRQIATLREPSSSRRWPMVGMFAIGMLAGALGVYAVTQRSRFARLAELAGRATVSRHDTPDELDGVELEDPVSVTSHRSNHRRKAGAEVR
jgi:hypothetical protein